MSRGKRKQKRKQIKDIPVALALILSKIPPATLSKKQLKEAEDKLYKDKAEFDYDTLC